MRAESGLTSDHDCLSPPSGATLNFRAINLGDEVRDKVTGWCGIAIAYTVTLGGFEVFEVQKKELDSEGRTAEQWFNAQRLEPTGNALVLESVTKIRRPIGFGV